MMNKQEISLMVEAGRTSVGIELGSTRIKAVLIGDGHKPLVSSSHEEGLAIERAAVKYLK